MDAIPAWIRHAPILIVAASVATLGAALVSQYFFGLLPCVLCLWQRWPYVATIVLGALAMPLWPRGALGPWLVALAGLAFLIGGGIAVFHVGVEQHWWQGTAECGGAPSARTVEELRAQLIGRPVVRCDEAQFRFLGVSMAGWNVLASAAFAAFSLAATKSRLAMRAAR